MRSGILARFRRKTRESGFGFLLLLAFRRLILEWWLGGNLIYVYSEDLTGRRIPTWRSTDKLRWADERDIDRFGPFGLDSSVVRARLKSGMRLIVLERDGVLAGLNWYDPHDHDEFGWLRYELAQGDVWAFDGQVLPTYRGSGVFAEMRNFAAKPLKEMGYRRVPSQVEGSTARRSGLGAKRVQQS